MADDQATILRDARAKVENTFAYLNSAIKSNDVDQIVRFATIMLQELRNGDLSPRNYYALYNDVMSHMLILQRWVRDRANMGEYPIERLYDRVQWVPLIPRLYLMITVGSVWIMQPGLPSGKIHNIFEDMLSMCRGVQQPIRGLFLRAYLSQLTRRALPEHDIDALNASINFLVTNFDSTTELWVRLGKQIRKDTCTVEIRERREAERMELRQLCLEAITRFNELNNVDEEVYVKMILPRLLKRIQSIDDRVVQACLLEAIIGSFPDEWHLAALDKYEQVLSMLCGDPRAQMDPTTVLGTLFQRLGRFFIREDAVDASTKALQLWDRWELAEFQRRAATLPWPPGTAPERIQVGAATLPILYRLLRLVATSCVAAGRQGNQFGTDQVITLYSSLLDVALRHWPISAANAVLAALAPALPEECEELVAEQVTVILKRCLRACSGLVWYLDLTAFPVVLARIRDSSSYRRDIALEFGRTAAKWEEQVPVQYLDLVLGAIRPIVIASPLDRTLTEAQVREDARVVCSLFEYLLPQADDFVHDTNSALSVFTTIREMLASGNSKRFTRTQYTYPPLIAIALARAEAIAPTVPESAHDVMRWVGGVLAEQRELTPLICHRFYIDAARRATVLGFADIVANFLLEALLLVEDYGATSAEKSVWLLDTASALIEAATYRNGALGDLNGEYEILARNVLTQAGCVLRKGDAATLVMRTASVWVAVNNWERVDRCVTRAVQLLGALRLQMTTTPEMLALSACRVCLTAFRLLNQQAQLGASGINMQTVVQLFDGALATANEVENDEQVTSIRDGLISYARELATERPDVFSFVNNYIQNAQMPDQDGGRVP